MRENPLAIGTTSEKGERGFFKLEQEKVQRLDIERDTEMY